MVGTVGVYDWRLESSKKWDGLLQLFFPIREEGPVGAVATSRGVLEHLHEHVLADGQIVSDRVLFIGGKSEGGKKEKTGREEGRI